MKWYWLCGVALTSLAIAQEPDKGPLHIEAGGRRISWWLPENSGNSPLPLVVWSGGAGSAGYDSKGAEMLKKALAEQDVQAVVATIELSDHSAHMFPGVDQGKSLLEAVDRLRKEVPLREKFLLTGFSRGGQFSHRFPWHARPDVLIAAAPLNGGGHVTRVKGGVWIREHGTFAPGDPMPFEPDSIWTEANWRSFLQPAKPGAGKVPMLVLCSLDDERWENNLMGFEDMRAHGFDAQASFRLPGTHKVTPVMMDRVAEFFREVLEAEGSTPPTPDAGPDREVASGEKVRLTTTLQPGETAEWRLIRGQRVHGGKWKQIKAAQRGELMEPFRETVEADGKDGAWFVAEANAGFEYIVQLDVISAEGRRNSDILKLKVTK